MTNEMLPHGFDRERALGDLIDKAKGGRWAGTLAASLRVGVAILDQRGGVLVDSPPFAHPFFEGKASLLGGLLAGTDPGGWGSSRCAPVAHGGLEWAASPLEAGGDHLGWLAIGPRSLEGEACGAPEQLSLVGRGTLRALLPPLRDSLEWIMRVELMRLMASDLHLETVEAGYLELAEANQKLRESEQRLQFMVEDLTRGVQSAAEETLRAHQDAFRNERQASIGRLAAGVAHEINNPMAFVTSNLGYVEDEVARLGDFLAGRPGAEPFSGDDVADLMDALSDARKGADRVSRIVADLRVFARIDAVDGSVVDLAESVRAAARLIESMIPPGARLELGLPDKLPVSCDGKAVNQAVMNLLDNALCAAREGARRIRLSCGRGEGAVWVEVEDDGPGISEEDLPLIFDPFFTTREVGQGAGLGLTVVRDVAVAHGGSVDVESSPGRGARFRLNLAAKGTPA